MADQRPFVANAASAPDSDVDSAGVLVKGKDYREREEVFAIYEHRREKIAAEERTITL